MKHSFQSTKAAASDQTLVDGPKWNAAHVLSVQSISVSTVLDATYDFVKATGGASGITITLPTAVGNSGVIYKIMKVDSGAGAVTIATSGAQTINSSSSYPLDNQWQCAEVESDGSNWTVSVPASITITGTPSLGTVPIGQGDGTAAFADPLVQGIQADGTTTSTINPVLVSGKGSDGNQHSLATDTSGQVKVLVENTVPISASSLPLPTGAALEAGGNLATIAGAVSSSVVQDNLKQVGGTSISLGSKASAASLPVVIASDQAAVPVSAASLPLPTGAATSAAQTTAQTSLSDIDTSTAAINAKLGSLGSKTSAGSAPVVIASDQASIPVKNQDGSGNSLASSTTAPTGAEQALIARLINRKNTTIETTTPLLASATFTGNWHDSQAEGTSYVMATSLSDKVGASGYAIQESDDTTNAGLTRNAVLNNGAPPATQIVSLIAAVRCRYWRVVYVNGATNQTTFELTTTASTVDPTSIVCQDGNVNNPFFAMRQAIIYSQGAATSNPAENTASVQQLQTANAAGTGPWDSTQRQYGGKFSGTANAALSGWSYSRMATVFKQITLTSSSSTTKQAIWTPGTGNKFRLLKAKVIVSGGAIISSAASEVTLTLYDGTTGMPIAFTLYLPTAAVNGATSFDFDCGNFGILSATANNALQAALGTALSAGTITIIAQGTEE